MRNRIVAVVIVVLMALTLIPFAAVSNSQPAQAVDVINCSSLRISSERVEIKCTAAGIVVLDTTVALPPGPTVSLPPIVRTVTESVTVRVPGPTSTQTIRVPVPGPTQRVTTTVRPEGATSTVTALGPTSTVRATATQTATARSTATVEITKTASGQPAPTSATLGPSASADQNDTPLFTFDFPDTTGEYVLSTGVILGIVAIILAALFGGYYLGYKDADNANASFIKRILN